MGVGWFLEMILRAKCRWKNGFRMNFSFLSRKAVGNFFLRSRGDLSVCNVSRSSRPFWVAIFRCSVWGGARERLIRAAGLSRLAIELTTRLVGVGDVVWYGRHTCTEAQDDDVVMPPIELIKLNYSTRKTRLRFYRAEQSKNMIKIIKQTAL